MKKKFISLVSILILTLVMASCGGRSEEAPAETGFDAEGTVAAVFAATAEFEAAVNAAAAELATTESSSDAMEPTATPETAVTTESESAETESMSEEELIILIEETVDEAVTATESYAETTSAATSDGEVTSGEVETIEVYVYGAEEAVAAAEELIDLYYTLYGDLAYTALDDLAAIEDDLEAIAASTAAMVTELEEINSTLEAGLVLAEETIAQLEMAAETAVAATTDLVAEAQTWAALAQEEIAARTAMIENFEPTQIATSQEEMVSQINEYANLVNEALMDSTLSQIELDSIAEAGANAVASINNMGGSAMQGLAGTIDSLTNQLAQGDFQSALASLSGLQSGISQLSSLTGGSVNLPSPAEGANLPQPGAGANLPQPGGNASGPRPSRP